MFPKCRSLSCNELENPIGIETLQHFAYLIFDLLGCNELENPIGIETVKMTPHNETEARSCNELENPIGIETLPGGDEEAAGWVLQRT